MMLGPQLIETPIRFSTGMGVSAVGAITVFGLLGAGFMWLIKRWHVRSCREHAADIANLLEIA